MSDTDTPLEEGTLIGDKYAIVTFVASGGMGTIYQARQQPLGRIVALKVMRQEFAADASLIRRFTREAQLISQLAHPNTITLFDFGASQDPELVYLVMEWLKGIDLGKQIQQHGPLSARRSARIAVQVARSLGQAHRHNIVHRDLKPANIFILEDGEHPDFIKVLDFGIAKAIEEDSSESELTQAGMLCGTPHYMSPEQAQAKELDGRSDIYALAAVIFTMLTGRVPFDGPTALTVATQHVIEPFPPLPGHVPEALRAIVRRASQKNPADRYPSAELLAQDLERFLEHAPHTDVANSPTEHALQSNATELPLLPTQAPTLEPKDNTRILRTPIPRHENAGHDPFAEGEELFGESLDELDGPFASMGSDDALFEEHGAFARTARPSTLPKPLQIAPEGLDLYISGDATDASLHLSGMVENGLDVPVKLNTIKAVLRNGVGRLLDTSDHSVATQFTNRCELLCELPFHTSALRSAHTLELELEYTVAFKVRLLAFACERAIVPKVPGRAFWPGAVSTPFQAQSLGFQDFFVSMEAFVGRRFESYCEFLIELRESSHTVDIEDLLVVLRGRDQKPLARESTWPGRITETSKIYRVRFDLDPHTLGRVRSVDVAIRGEANTTMQLANYQRTPQP